MLLCCHHFLSRVFFSFSHFSLNDKRVFVKEQAWEEYLIPYLVYSSLTFQFVIRLMFSLKLNISLHVPLLLVATCEIVVLDFCKLKPFIHEMKPCFMQIYVCYKIDIALYDRILMRLKYMKSCNTNIYQNVLYCHYFVIGNGKWKVNVFLLCSKSFFN